MNTIFSLLKQFGLYSTQFGLWLLAYTLPIHSFIITILVLLFFDLVTGIYKAIKAGEKITSKRLRDSIIKMVFYTIAVFIGYQVDITILSDASLVLARLVAGYIILIEFTSNMENISSITGVNIWLAIKNKALAFFNSKIDPPKTGT